MTWSRRSYLQASAGLGIVISSAGCLALGPDPEEQLAEAAEHYEHLATIDSALDAGFRAFGSYVRTLDGGLGEVFFSEHLPFALEPEELEPEHPTLLFSRLNEDGTYEPIGVGWSIPEDAADGTPELFGKDFHDPSEHHVPGQANHYGLHAWVFDDEQTDVFAPVHPDLEGPPFVDELKQARDALDQFRAGAENGGSEFAEDESYENTEEHIFFDDGLYGVPFYGGTRDELDLADPPILLYRMTDQWYYELLGAEWYVPTDAADGPPELLGQSFHDAMAGHSPHTNQPEHYGIHAWLYRANPRGMFELVNPRFT